MGREGSCAAGEGGLWLRGGVAASGGDGEVGAVVGRLRGEGAERWDGETGPR